MENIFCNWSAKLCCNCNISSENIFWANFSFIYLFWNMDFTNIWKFYNIQNSHICLMLFAFQTTQIRMRRYDFRIECISYMSTVLPFNFKLYSMRYPMTSVENVNFCSHSLFDNKGYGHFLSFKKYLALLWVRRISTKLWCAIELLYDKTI